MKDLVGRVTAKIKATILPFGIGFGVAAILCVLAYLLIFVFQVFGSGEEASDELYIEPYKIGPNSAEGNFTDDMKITPAVELEAFGGADTYMRAGDHANSPYYNHFDFYDAVSYESLTILPGFKTYQQTSEWSCGPSSALMVLDYYGKLGTYNEETLAMFRTAPEGSELPSGTEYGPTSLRQMMEMFEGVGGFDLYSTYDMGEMGKNAPIEFTLDFIRDTLAAYNPIMVGWNDWGGHWQVIIGYDTMGTDATNDDVIIVADPYDSTDHNQDGYGVYGAERFLYNFTFYDYFTDDEINDCAFLIATPEQN
jgi:hypothetical protein